MGCVTGWRTPTYSHRPIVMPTLNQFTSRDFLARFASFSDSLLRRLEIKYEETGQRTVFVWVAARDLKGAQSDSWVCIRFAISSAQDFCFSESARTTAQVISHGIHIGWFGDVVGLDFGHLIDPPKSLKELALSKFFVTGTSVDWSVEPY